MLDVDPATRITANEVIAYPWIKQNVTAGPDIPETASTAPLEGAMTNLRTSFSGKRKFKAAVRKQIFIHSLQASVAEKTADGTLERTITETIVEAIGGEHPIDPHEYVTGVNEALLEHGESGGLVSIRQVFRSVATNQICADTGAKLQPTDTYVNPTLGVFLSPSAAQAHEKCGFSVVKMDAPDITPEQIARVSTHGNEVQNGIFEAMPSALEAKAT